MAIVARGQWFQPQLFWAADEGYSGDWFCSPFHEKKNLGGNTASQWTRPKTTPIVLWYKQPPQTQSSAVLFLEDCFNKQVGLLSHGPNILIHWECPIPHFYQSGHPKYFILGTRNYTDISYTCLYVLTHFFGKWNYLKAIIHHVLKWNVRYVSEILELAKFIWKSLVVLVIKTTNIFFISRR